MLDRRLTPSEGIYYATRRPLVWRLFVLKHSESEVRAHAELWERQLALEVAKDWAPAAQTHDLALHRSLVNCPYAFPRGRVVKQGRHFVVYHGDDLEPFMKVSRRMIERSFRIEGKARWLLDEHERCQREDKELVRDLLGVRENWKDAGSWA